MRLIANNYLLDMLDRFYGLLLLARNASQLIVRVDLFRIDLYGAFETLACRFQFAALLMNQSQIVVGRRVRRIERCGFQILFERRARSLRSTELSKISAQQHEQHKQQKW